MPKTVALNDCNSDRISKRPTNICRTKSIAWNSNWIVSSWNVISSSSGSNASHTQLANRRIYIQTVKVRRNSIYDASLEHIMLHGNRHSGVDIEEEIEKVHYPKSPVKINFGILVYFIEKKWILDKYFVWRIVCFSFSFPLYQWSIIWTAFKSHTQSQIVLQVTIMGKNKKTETE